MIEVIAMLHAQKSLADLALKGLNCAEGSLVVASDGSIFDRENELVKDIITEYISTTEAYNNLILSLISKL